MATRAFTNVSSTINGGMQPISFGGEDGLIIVFYRVQGGTVGDTVTIPASDTRWSDDIRSAAGTLDATTGLSTSAANTQIVLTMTSSAASTSVNYDLFLICKRQTT